MTKLTKIKSGQILVSLLVFTSIAIIIASGATIVTLINSQSTSYLDLGQKALQTAEAAAENAILRLLRDSNYAGETLDVESGTATITVSGTSTKNIIATGTNGNFKRKVQVVATYTNNILSITSWQEIE